MTKVIFRKWRNNGDIIALFPELIADNWGNCESYMSLGQHAAAGYNYLVYGPTIPATPEEYANLLSELESIGYNDLVIRQKHIPRRNT